MLMHVHKTKTELKESCVQFACGFVSVMF